MKNNNNQWERLKIVLALTFFVISFLSFSLVQAADLPCCHKCDPFCEYTEPDENGKGWDDCESWEEPSAHCSVEVGDYTECNKCDN